jgi:alpha-N-acetylglucosamine transferase
LDYLPGILTLAHSLQRVGTHYPLVALYTDAVPAEALAALDARKITRRRVPHLLPAGGKYYTDDARFNDTWTKLVAFSLTDYDRVVLLDSDMLIRRNMDELMTLDLDPPSADGNGQRVFGASHACACNPMKKPHYPANWYAHRPVYVRMPLADVT